MVTFRILTDLVLQMWLSYLVFRPHERYIECCSYAWEYSLTLECFDKLNMVQNIYLVIGFIFSFEKNQENILFSCRIIWIIPGSRRISALSIRIEIKRIIKEECMEQIFLLPDWFRVLEIAIKMWERLWLLV